MKAITKYVENKNFHTTLINCIFEFSCDNNEIMAMTILAKLLSKTNNKYPKIDLFAKEKMNRYIMNFNVLNQSINNVYFLNFSMLIPSNNVISENFLEDSIDFLLDSIYDTNIFNQELFDKEKRLYTEMLLNNYKNIEFIAEKNMLNLIDEEGTFNKIKYKDIENINTLTKEDIINFYNKYIKNIKPKVFINGNIDLNKAEKTFSNYFNKINLKEYKIINNFNSFYDKDTLVDKTEYSKHHQSIVYMIYNIKDYNETDFYKLYMINLLLSSSSSDILLNNLRKKSNLVYACGSSIMIKNGLLFIRALTNKDNVKLVKLIIEEVISSLKCIENYKDNINKILYRLTMNLEREKDNFYTLSSNIINKYFKCDINSEEELEILKNITEDDLKGLIDKIELKCIYTLEGVL